MKLYLRKDLASKVNELKQYYSVITASNQGILMMTTKEWSVVTDCINTTDSNFKDMKSLLDINLDFLDCCSLWAECFCVYYNEDETESFWGINSHETFVKVCRCLNVYPVVIPYDDIPWCFMKDFISTENPEPSVFEAIEFIDN
jgi:hypothetical protein